MSIVTREHQLPPWPTATSSPGIKLDLPRTVLRGTSSTSSLSAPIMARPQSSKPYARPDSRKSADGPGGWKHDLHAAAAQRESSSAGGAASRLASRLSSGGASASTGNNRRSGGGADLLSRMSGHGTELLPANGSSTARGRASGDGNASGNTNGKMLGWNTNPATLNSANPNAGVELLGDGNGATSRGGTGPMRTTGGGGGGGGRALGSRIVASGMAAAGLGGGGGRDARPRQSVRPLAMDVDMDVPVSARVSIMGAASSRVIVRVENLAQGTTPEDVMSAFAPSPIVSATLTSPPPAGHLVSVDLEYASKAPAEELILQYNGAVADGNALKLSLVRAGLGERMGHGNARASAPVSASASSRAPPSRDVGRSEAGRELFGSDTPGKMYSDSILASNPTSSIITLADSSSSRSSNIGQRQRAEAWNGGGRSLASRVGR